MSDAQHYGHDWNEITSFDDFEWAHVWLCSCGDIRRDPWPSAPENQLGRPNGWTPENE